MKNLSLRYKMYMLLLVMVILFGTSVGYSTVANNSTKKEIGALNTKDLKVFQQLQTIKENVLSIKDNSYSFISIEKPTNKTAKNFINKINKTQQIITTSLNKVIKQIEEKKIISNLKKIKNVRVSALISSASEMAYTYSDSTSKQDDKNFDYQTFQTNATIVTNELNKISNQMNIVLKQATSKIQENINKRVLYTAYITLISLLISITYILILFKTVIVPLNKTKEGLFSFFDFLNNKNSKFEKIDLNQKDEFGEMAKEINTNIDNIRQALLEDEKMIKNAADTINLLKQGKYITKVEFEPYNQNLKSLKTELNMLIEALQKNLGKDLNIMLNLLKEYATFNFENKIEEAEGILENQINNLGIQISKMLNENFNTGSLLNHKSDQLRNNFKLLSNSSNQQASSLEETAASIEEITGNIRSNTEKAEKMTFLANEAKSTAISGTELINENKVSMEAIDESTKRIDEAISQIEQIAFQTNILSLNAAVEAATAGENGKGFSVVATEVRNLATKSADVAKDIKILVAQATEKTREGKEISNSINSAFSELNEKIGQTAELVEEVSEANKEQLLGMEQINSSSNNLDLITQDSLKVVNETEDITTDLLTMSELILKEVNKKKFMHEES